SLGLLVLLEVFFYLSGWEKVLLISLKLSFLHLGGYLIALRLFKDEFDTVALLFLGFAFSLIAAALLYYLPTLFGVNANSLTYVVPVVVVAIGTALHIQKKSPSTTSE
ncbi:MAG: hypothetical protein AABY26_03760, partial [Nanoarchaeota archaeon]